MAKRTRLPMIVLGRTMTSGPPTEKASFELEAETGEIFEISFSLRGLLSTVAMALNWAPLREELAQLELPTKL